MKERDDYYIDRDEENKKVLEYQKTGDLTILEELYQKRVQTLKNWVRKHYYTGLFISEEDFYSELCIVFMKAAEEYKKGRGSFNTCLYTFLSNRIKNIKSMKYTKKRKIKGLVLSLDLTYSFDNEKVVTLKEIIPARKENSIKNYQKMDCINYLSGNNKILEKFFIGLYNGNSIPSLLREFNYKKGYIKGNISKITKKEAFDLIKEKYKKDFKLISYKISSSNNLVYEIEFKRTKATDLIKDKLEDIRENKKVYKKCLI